MTTTRSENQHQLSKIRRLMQGFFVAGAFLIGLRHMLPGESSKGGAFDAFCPFGGVETLWAYVTTAGGCVLSGPCRICSQGGHAA
jgi:hypothetical protein